ncbi:EGF and laminin G domain-containing protein-like [Dendronephthya gigantea]|uniref:EGF and laminin G domain-containing protein-like n=1 Tax=Dendronephthya gigantea TaxID=151771 RepID=UPI00106C380B|nr:EGF and laminin G domain-containing protein-like [Dendronephthya gigantea]
MAVNVIAMCFLWFVALTTSVKGNYKSCAEIKDAKVNTSATYTIQVHGETVEVSCNLTSQPVLTIIKVRDIIRVTGSIHSQSYSHNVDYGSLSVNVIRAFIEQSESCKQYVSYKCSNATLFGKGQSALSSWTSISDSPNEYWAGCSFSDKDCRCDQENNNPEEDAGYLTKKRDLPVKAIQIGGLSSSSNVSVEIGNIVCYGDNEKGSHTFLNRDAFVSLDVSSMQELKFKFKSSRPKADVIIASIQMRNDMELKIGLNNNSELSVGHKPFHKMDEEWHSIVLTKDSRGFYAVVDNGKKGVVFETLNVSTVGAKLILGDRHPQRKCRAFIGCVKGLTVDGQDYTSKITESKNKASVKEGCSPPTEAVCDPSTTGNPSTNPPITSTVSKVENTTKTATTKTPGSGGEVDSGGNDDAAIIAIVVVFLILLIILVAVFFITWYLKRNKGVYQTHEGSAEDIHGDTDNLTLVTKPGEQEAEGDQGKEYYL